MKKIIFAGLIFASINAYSQSYMVLSNGVTLTTDRAGYVYDFNHFRLPYEIAITGGQFFVEGEKLNTVDKNGYLYEKKLKVKKIRGKGLNYFITKGKELITVDENGFIYEFEDKQFKKAELFGGNFFTIEPKDKKSLGEIFTINSQGNFFKAEVEGLNPAFITALGGTYFQTSPGVVYTVSKDGIIFPKPEIKTARIKESGGNFFIDYKKQLYTVAESGLLILPTLPANLNVSDIKNIGANYMIDSAGRIFLVDQNGNVVERSVQHDLTSTKHLSR